MVAPLETFPGHVVYFGGAGCLICGSNYTNEGAKVGIQGVSLEVEVEMEGALALCYDCAFQVGRAIGMETTNVTQQKVDYSLELLEEAKARETQAAADAAQARLDKDTVERLIGSVYVEQDNVPFGAGVGA